MAAITTLKSGVGRFLAGALGLSGSAAAGMFITTATANPVSLTLLGIIAAFAGGAAVYRGAKSAEHDKQTEQILLFLEKQLKQNLSLAKALANLSNDESASFGECGERIRAMHEVFMGGIGDLHDQLARHPEFVAFVQRSMAELEANDDEFRIALNGLIDSAIEQKQISNRQIGILNGLDAKVDEVLTTQEELSNALKRIELLLEELRTTQTGECLGDESLQQDLVAAIRRLADDAERGVLTAQRVIETENPNNIADYLAARRLQLEENTRTLVQCIDEEAFQLDREFAAVAFTTGRIAEAEEALDRILDAFPNDLDALNQLGHIHDLHGRLDEAVSCYRRVLDLADNEVWKAKSYGNLGLISQTQGDLDEAEAMHRKALRIDSQMGRTEGMASHYGNLGLVMEGRGDLDKAEAMYRKSLTLNEQLGRPKGMANQFGNLGNVMLARGALDEAEAMYHKALEINEQLGRLEGMANQHTALGNVMKKRGDLQTAREMWVKARRLFEKLGAAHMVEKTQGLIDGLPDNDDDGEGYGISEESSPQSNESDS